jgi:hypothetical protein
LNLTGDRKMKKLITASVVLAGMVAAPVASFANNINHIDGFQGGFEVWDSAGGYCLMSTNDAGGVSTPMAAALTGGANHTNDVLYNAYNTGWGYGVYGGYTCTNIHIYF